MFWRSVALTLDCCVCVRRRRVDSGFSPQRSITASRRSVVFEIACLHNRNNKHRLTFCHVAFANLCSSRRHHRADRVARRALCEILASRYYHRRVQGAAFEVTVETGSCRRSLAALSLTRLAPTLSRAQVLLDRDMPNPATMKLYHEELQAMVLAVDSELPALHETVETLKRKREACTETFKELVDCRTGCKTCHKDKMADPKYARSAAHQKRAMHNCSHVSCEGGAACVMPTRKRAIRSVVVAAHARVCVCAGVCPIVHFERATAVGAQRHRRRGRARCSQHEDVALQRQDQGAARAPEGAQQVAGWSHASADAHRRDKPEHERHSTRVRTARPAVVLWSLASNDVVRCRPNTQAFASLRRTWRYCSAVDATNRPHAVDAANNQRAFCDACWSSALLNKRHADA